MLKASINLPVNLLATQPFRYDCSVFIQNCLKDFSMEFFSCHRAKDPSHSQQEEEQ